MKRILVALDGSPLAPTVLGAATRMAQLADARLILFRAISIPSDMPREVLNLVDRSLEDVLVGNAHAELERFAAGLPAGVVERIVTPFATAWDGICRTARELDVDLIVIGSHGYGGIDRVLGTTAAKVVNHADRNVLVVRTLL
ncbi:MAG TPA: universal stress protein [Kofleriaceae bacterium]|nr:universal stress protein [Kofleriaceae bacterium]